MMVRQYFPMNLCEKFYSIPRLSMVEKKWFTFQLLKALVQMHELGFCHGDIKAENVMVTTWNWLILT